MYKHDTSDDRDSMVMELVVPALFLAGLFSFVALISTLG